MLSLAFLGAVSLMSFSTTYKRMWQKVAEAEEQGLPQTQKKLLNKILKKAEKAKDLGEYFKAYLVYDDVTDQLGEREFEQSIDLLEDWLKQSDDKIEQSILHNLLVKAYGTYYQRNITSPYERTDLGDDSEDDIRFWSKAQFIEMVELHQQKVFEHSDLLLKTSAKDLIPYVTTNPFSKYFNYDLYHVLYKELLKSERDFSMIFDDTQFAKRIHSSSLKHYENSRESQFLLKLESVKNSRYYSYYFRYFKEDNPIQDELDLLIQEYKDLDLVVEAIYLSSTQLIFKKAYEQALEMCEEAKVNYPNYDRIDILESQIEKIKKPDLYLALKGERVYPGESILNEVNYRNVSEFTIEINEVTKPVESLSNSLLTDDFWKSSTEFYSVTKRDVELSYNPAKLTEVVATIDKEGVFVVKLSTLGQEAPIYKWLHSTKAELVFYDFESNAVEFIVVDGLTGQPIEGADLSLYNNRDKTKVERTIRTNKVGKAITTCEDGWQYLVGVSLNGKTLIYPSSVYMSRLVFSDDIEKSSARIITDRNIYRPGQTVSIKGYIFQQKSGNKEVLAGYVDTLSIETQGGVKLIEQEIISNEYGSFALEVKLPQKMLTGFCLIKTSNSKAFGSIAVEEYKRPSFTINVDPINSKYSAGDTISLTGKVESFSAALLKGAQLKVEAYGNENLLPIFRQLKSNKELIKHGEVPLDQEGVFTLLLPLPKEESGVVTLNLTLTSISGETQTKSENIYFNSYTHDLRVDLNDKHEKESPLVFKVEARNSSSVSVESSGFYELVLKSEKDNEKVVKSGSFKSGEEIEIICADLPSDIYTLKLIDELDKERERVVTSDVALFSLKDSTTPNKQGEWLYVKKEIFSENSPALFAYGVAEDSTFVYVSVYGESGSLLKKEISLNREFKVIELPYKEEYGRGIKIVFTFVKRNEVFHCTQQFNRVPDDSDLFVEQVKFRDKLEPGAKEQWTFKVVDGSGKSVDAELLAYMYDASLDALTGKKELYLESDFFHINTPYPRLINNYSRSERVRFIDKEELMFSEPSYSTFYSWNRVKEPSFYITGLTRQSNAAIAVHEPSFVEEDTDFQVHKEKALVSLESGASPQNESVRENFDETAFFYPQIHKDNKGDYSFVFDTPQQLTKWVFTAVAHTKEMSLKQWTKEVVTDQDFSILMNPPRYIREGDKLAIRSVLQNRLTSTTPLVADVTFMLIDPLTDEVISKQNKKITVNSKSEAALSFDVEVDEGLESVICKVVAKSNKLTDGEQYLIPILSNKVDVVESCNALLVESGLKKIDIRNLFSKTATADNSQVVSVEMANDPSWYALPFMVNAYNQEGTNALQIANRLSALIYGGKLVERNPMLKDGEFRKRFNSLATQTEKDDRRYQDLAMTPWLRANNYEAQLADFLEDLTIETSSKSNLSSLLSLLLTQQNPDGGWSWFDGFESSTGITLLIVKTLDTASKLDWLKQEVESLEKAKTRAIKYLVTSRMETDKSVDSNRLASVDELNILLFVLNNPSVNSNLNKLEQEYLTNILDRTDKLLAEGSIGERALTALVLHEKGDVKRALKFVASLKESLNQTEYGAYYKQVSTPYARVNKDFMEEHLMAMKAIECVDNDAALINQMKRWLMNKVQTDQFYNAFVFQRVVACLIAGNEQPTPSKETKLNIGDREFTLGGNCSYIREKIELPKETKMITIEKSNSSPVWLNLVAKNKETLQNVEQTGTGVSINKRHFIEKITDNGKTLVSLKANDRLNVGDVVVSRLSFVLDNDLSYVHIKDDRSAGLEPVDHLSGLVFSAGLPVYRSITDTATHFYYYRLSKGAYVIEHRSFVTRQGEVQSGIATIQSSYTPEITAHSESVELNIE